MASLTDVSTVSTFRALTPQRLTSASFAPYGQVIGASVDGKPFDDQDAQLVLDQGMPRFYIMRLAARGLGFDRITRHRRCTQCLGSLMGQAWYLGVAPPESDPLDPEAIEVFRIPGDCFIKLHLGTWHAGPHFQDPEWIDFYNLELADTNLVDHDTVNLRRQHGLIFHISDKSINPASINPESCEPKS